MLILTIRTDKPEAEIGLYEDHKQLAYDVWAAHRQLAETIHSRIKALLIGQGKDWHDIEGIVFFKGPGSFTGLRIGASVANALSKGLGIPIVGSDYEWIENGIERLIDQQADNLALPEYGEPAKVTKQTK